MNTPLTPQLSKYRISRRGRKLQISDDVRTLAVLPKEVPERTWAEIMQKEENDLIVFDVREEILESALKIGYDHYMEVQNALFTAHCAAEAWLKLIDWHFYRHDPGEEPSAFPPCYIPKRVESWVPDELPDISPKDTWAKQELIVVEDTTEDGLQSRDSNVSINIPVIEDIPSEFWFPGKVLLPGLEKPREEKLIITTSSYDMSNIHMVTRAAASGVCDYVQASVQSQSEDLAADSELLQRVTDYSTEELYNKESTLSALKNTTPVEGSLQGAGDSTVAKFKRKPEKSRTFNRFSSVAKQRGLLPGLDRDSRSKLSLISDCRLRNLRLDTQYEISSEKLDTPPGEPVKRK